MKQDHHQLLQDRAKRRGGTLAERHLSYCGHYRGRLTYEYTELENLCMSHVKYFKVVHNLRCKVSAPLHQTLVILPKVGSLNAQTVR